MCFWCLYFFFRYPLLKSKCTIFSWHWLFWHQNRIKMFFVHRDITVNDTSNKRKIVGELGNQFAAIIICWPSILGCDRRDQMWKTRAFFIVLHLFCFDFNVRHAACNHNSSYLNCLFDVCKKKSKIMRDHSNNHRERNKQRREGGR